MSSISSVSQGLFQFLNSVNSNSQSSQTTAGNTTTNDGADLIAGSNGEVQGTSHHGHHGGGKFKEIESAVTNALQSATDSTNGTSTTDPNTIVQNAIAQVLGQNASGTSGATPASATTPNTAETAGADGNSPSSNFIQTLEQHGINPQQFRQDFLAAFQNANNSQNLTDPSQTIPPGSVVDTTI